MDRSLEQVIARQAEIEAEQADLWEAAARFIDQPWAVMFRAVPQSIAASEASEAGL